MNVQKIVQSVKKKFQSVPDRLALTLLIWLEKEPSQQHSVLSPSPSDTRGPYLRNRVRRELNKKETVA